MNYLAHAYLSFNRPEILVGNIISDFVKGKKRFDFSETIQKGIMLHRSIDTFTDEHEATKKAKQFFKPVVGLYAGAFVDVAYDHFLARDKNEFIDESLKEFSITVYATLTHYQTILPGNFARILPYMKKDNWLYNYKTLNGIEQSFGGLLRRAKYLENHLPVYESFLENYQQLQHCYSLFFGNVKDFAFKQLKEIDVK
jgi:acyl carrier protein phosphodiesterase